MAELRVPTILSNQCGPGSWHQLWSFRIVRFQGNHHWNTKQCITQRLAIPSWKRHEYILATDKFADNSNLLCLELFKACFSHSMVNCSINQLAQVASHHHHTTHSHEILSMIHTHQTFTFFPSVNTDGRNAAVDPHWGRVVYQTLPYPPLSHSTHTRRVWEPNFYST